MHQITLFQDKKFKNFLGRGHYPLPRPHPQWGGGHPSPHPTPRGHTALDTRPPLSKILDPPLHLWIFHGRRLLAVAPPLTV